MLQNYEINRKMIIENLKIAAAMKKIMNYDL